MNDVIQFCYDQCDDLSPAEKRELAGLLQAAARAEEDAARTSESTLRGYLLHIKARRITLPMLQKQIDRERPGLNEDLEAEVNNLVGESRWKAIATVWDNETQDYEPVDVGEEGDEIGRFYNNGYEVPPSEIVYFYDTEGKP